LLQAIQAALFLIVGGARLSVLYFGGAVRCDSDAFAAALVRMYGPARG